MVKVIYVLATLMLLAACNTEGLNSEYSASTASGAVANETEVADEQEKYQCETKGGYYSKTLGCFE
jgi:hypothetical protein